MIDPVTFSVVDITLDAAEGGRVIDSIGYSRAFYELFEGAVYLHQARQYLVTRLDLRTHVASVKPVKVNYYTSSRNHTTVDVTKRLESGLGICSIVSTGNVNVVSRVWGWRKHWASAGKVKDMGTFTLPPLEFSTRAFWIDVPPAIQLEVESLGELTAPSQEEDGDNIEAGQLCTGGGCCCKEAGGDKKGSPVSVSSSGESGNYSSKDSSQTAEEQQANREGRRFSHSIHGLNHVLTAVAPLFVLTEHEDICTEHVHPMSNRICPPRVIIFDKRPGGIGVAQVRLCILLFILFVSVYGLLLSKLVFTLTLCCVILVLFLAWPCFRTSNNSIYLLPCKTLFACAPALLSKAYAVISTCPCATGCLGCLLDPRCSNQTLDKQGTLLLTKRLLEMLRGVKIYPEEGENGERSDTSSPPSSPLPSTQGAAEEEEGEEGSTTRGGGGGGGGGVESTVASPFASTSSRMSWSSPRRRQRLLRARSMDEAREQGAQVRPEWTNTMMPEFQSMFD
jgi:hypothetical protein